MPKTKSRPLPAAEPISPRPAAIQSTHAWRVDLLHGAALVVIVVLLWCAHYDRWSVANWQVPLSYLGDSTKNDVFLQLGYVRAAHDGHFSPFWSNRVPELGAPGDANWNDFPVPEKPMLMVTGLLAGPLGLFAAANFMQMMAFVLAALAFYASARVLGSSPVWAAGCGLVFAFSRYGFSHGIHHLTVIHFWQVPLGLVACEWLLQERGIPWRSARFYWAMAAAVLIGGQHIYYTFMLGQLVMLGALYQAWRRGARAALPALAVAATMVAACVVVDLNTIVFQMMHGAGAAVDRPFQWLEFYGLKLDDLVIPPPDHPVPFLAAWGAQYGQETMLANGERPPSAYLGLVGLGAVAWLTLASLRRAALKVAWPVEALLILWIVIYSCVGGLNGLAGALGFTLIRATTRYSLFILCLALFFAARRLPHFAWARERLLAYPLALGLALFAYWDCAPPTFTDADVAEVAAQVDSDRAFVAMMEARLPDGAMVFDVPVMDYPESPGVVIGGSDELRPYLYSHHLRYSFGTNKGRGENEWQHALEHMPPASRINELISQGFSAVCLDRDGYDDHGLGLLRELSDLGYANSFQSPRGDLVCVILSKK